MLNKSLMAVGVTNVKVVAIINDTTGTLVAGSHDYPDTAIGLILGTGTNGSYMEKAHRVVRSSDLCLLPLKTHFTNVFLQPTRWEERESKQNCIIDPEFGAWGDNGLSLANHPFHHHRHHHHLTVSEFGIQID